MTRREDEQVVLVFEGPVHESNIMLPHELNSAQPSYYQEDIIPSMPETQGRITQELSFDEIQQILDLPPADLLGLAPMERKSRSLSACSEPTGSPESGISGCDTVEMIMSPPSVQQSPMDPVMASLEQAQILPVQGYLDTIDLTGIQGLMELADHSNQLMLSTNFEMESHGPIHSPLTRDTNPLISQVSPSSHHTHQDPQSNQTRYGKPIIVPSGFKSPSQLSSPPSHNSQFSNFCHSPPISSAHHHDTPQTEPVLLTWLHHLLSSNSGTFQPDRAGARRQQAPSACD